MLHIYNTLTKQKELFKPAEAGKIKIYVCGLTAYDYCHIGHGRIFVVFDTIVRYLKNQGLEVTYARNITDIDDKIINRAKQLNEDPKSLSERFIQIMHEDEAALGVLPPTIEPRATDHILEMISMISVLMHEGYAYLAESGDVYFGVNKFKNYGALSHQKLADLKAGARVEVGELKRDPLDFVLWKASKPGEPTWDAPWGAGRPGWHIECSAMSTLHLGKYFDIHGGGADLKFPHHENEIAQSEATLGHKVVNYWLHVGFVEIDKIKMSKSKGNFFTLREVFKQYNPEVIRYFLLASHYRSPLNYTEENLNSAHTALTRLYLALRDLPATPATTKPELPKLSKQEQIWWGRFNEAMDDDFNTPEALAILFEMVKTINKLREEATVDTALLNSYVTTLKNIAAILGLLTKDPADFLKQGITIDEVEIETLITKRNQARSEKNWQAADLIRNTLAKAGIELEDTDQGTTWRKK